MRFRRPEELNSKILRQTRLSSKADQTLTLLERLTPKKQEAVPQGVARQPTGPTLRHSLGWRLMLSVFAAGSLFGAYIGG